MRICSQCYRVLLLLCLVTTPIISAESNSSDTWVSFSPLFPKSEFSPYHSGTITPTFQAIQDKAQWQALWTSMHMPFWDPSGKGLSPAIRNKIASSLPEIDFEHFTLLVASPGMEHPSAMSISIVAIIDHGQVLEIRLVKSISGIDCTYIDIQRPIALALVSKTLKEVDFQVSTAVRTKCSEPRVTK